MLGSINKARNYTAVMNSTNRTHRAHVPNAFTAPPSGYGYYGQGYHTAQVLNYTAWAYIAIKALIREIAGGKGPNLGTVTDRDDEGDNWGDRQRSYGAKRKSYRPAVEKNLGGPREHEQFTPWPSNHPGRKLFDKPNHIDVPYDFWAWDTLFFHLCGSSHWWLIRDRMGIPREMWVIPTHWMRMITGPDLMPIAYQIRNPWGQVQYALYKDVVSFYEHGPLSRWEGYAVTIACAKWLDIYDSVMTTQLALFKNGAQPTIHVELDESYPNPDDAMLRRYYAKWFQRFGGEVNAGQPVITGPGIKLNVIGNRPNEIGFEGSEEAIRNRVLAAFGVPQALVTGDPTVDTSAYAPQRTFCLSDDTQILTANGWKGRTEVTDDTLIACYDKGSGKIIYRRPTNRIEYQHTGVMRHWSNDYVDLLVTPKHRMHFKKKRSHGLTGFWQTAPANNVPRTSGLTVKCGARAACEFPVPIELEPYTELNSRGHYRTFGKQVTIDPELWLAFIGLYVSEGHIHGRAVGITQAKNSPWTPVIEEIMARMPYNVCRYESSKDLCCYQWCIHDKALKEHILRHCGQHSKYKRLPDYVKAWPAESLDTLLKFMIAGDGRDPVESNRTATNIYPHQISKKHLRASYTTSSRQLADDFQEIAVKCGWRTKLTFSKGDDGREGYGIYISDCGEAFIGKKDRRVVTYNGMVWCVEVPTGLIIARRNGKATIVGNCRFTVNPLLTYKAQVATHTILRPTWDYGTCWWDDRVPNDPQYLLQEIGTRKDNFAISPNEVRAKFGADPWPHGGDDPMNAQGEELGWQTGKKPANNPEGQSPEERIEQAYRKALGGNVGTNGGYLVPTENAPFGLNGGRFRRVRDEKDLREQHRGMVDRLQQSIGGKNGNGKH